MLYWLYNLPVAGQNSGLLQRQIGREVKIGSNNRWPVARDLWLKTLRQQTVNLILM